MTAGLLNLTELSAESGVPAPRLRQYAEAGLLPPARRDGGRLGYPPAEVTTVRALAGAEDLGLDADTLATLAAGWRDGECTSTQHRLAAAVTARLDQVQADIAERNRQAVAAGPGTAAWATEIGGSASLSEDAARLQAVSAALTTAAHDGPCGDGCGCATALAAAGTTYHFPHDATSSEAALACDLVADGGDAHDRIGVWQQALARVERRDPLPDTPDGVALRFPFDVELAASLGRLAAAEYRCCSFGSYTLIVDGAGLRLEVRMPGEAAGMLAAVVGLPDTGVNDAAHQP
ncbi:MerR family transcriptional regulator [Actinoplanes flavus]|uniref:MerR family transcriptional regulator n=1 Tax=Actinoplanes flavus TaxID=2820290 RepID=A0ABS3UVS9_9ACTN|nr:MerR family transcriptional regulator [Actinoplanes flavus]MBO3742672.1 MerR family transcriptional regulator [Actinoplanes flavus]